MKIGTERRKSKWKFLKFKPLTEMQEKVAKFGVLFDLDQLEEGIAEAEAKMAEPGFGMIVKPHKK